MRTLNVRITEISGKNNVAPILAQSSFIRLPEGTLPFVTEILTYLDNNFFDNISEIKVCRLNKNILSLFFSKQLSRENLKVLYGQKYFRSILSFQGQLMLNFKIPDTAFKDVKEETKEEKLIKELKIFGFRIKENNQGKKMWVVKGNYVKTRPEAQTILKDLGFIFTSKLVDLNEDIEEGEKVSDNSYVVFTSKSGNEFGDWSKQDKELRVNLKKYFER